MHFSALTTRACPGGAPLTCSGSPCRGEPEKRGRAAGALKRARFNLNRRDRARRLSESLIASTKVSAAKSGGSWRRAEVPGNGPGVAFCDWRAPAFGGRRGGVFRPGARHRQGRKGGRLNALSAQSLMRRGARRFDNLELASSLGVIGWIDRFFVWLCSYATTAV